MFLTKKHLSRRTAIKGLGVTLALPMLEAMVPAVTAQRRTVAGAPRVRLACLEMVHGSAGATRFGAGRNLWSPAAAGRQFDLTPTSLKPLEPFRDYITIVSNTDCRMAEAFTDNEVGGEGQLRAAPEAGAAHHRHRDRLEVRELAHHGVEGPEHDRDPVERVVGDVHAGGEGLLAVAAEHEDRGRAGRAERRAQLLHHLEVDHIERRAAEREGGDRTVPGERDELG